MKLLKNTLSSILWILISLHFVYARDKNIRDVFSPDRPYFTNASATVKKHKLQVETGYSVKIYNRIINHNIGELMARAGVFNNLELRFGIDSYAINENNDRTRDGKKDGSLGLRIALLEPEGSSFTIIPFAALTAEARVPTGTPVLREKAFQPGTSLSLSWILSSIFTLRTTGGYARISEQDRIYNMFSAGISLTASFYSSVRAFTEYMIQNPSGYEAGSGHFFSAGLIWCFSRSLFFDSKLSMAVKENKREYIIGAGACGIVSFR